VRIGSDIESDEKGMLSTVLSIQNFAIARTIVSLRKNIVESIAL
jgi:hypothetical protein